MLQDLLSMFSQTITVAPYVSQNSYGEPTYGTAVSYAARVQGKMQMVRDSMGQERVSTVTCFVATTATISPKDKLELPLEFIPRQPPILAVERQSDEIGLHHVVLFA